MMVSPKRMKKTPMGFDAEGNSVWVDNPVVTIPDEFTLNIAGQSIQFERAYEDAYCGAEVGFKSQGGKMWDAEIHYDDDWENQDLFFLAVNPDGQFESMIGITRDGCEEDNNMDFMGKNPNMDSILSNFERYLNDVYPSLMSRYPVNKSTKKSKKATKRATKKGIKKQLNPKKCANYLGMPVCPECGSPSLQELGEKEGKTYWVCARCYTPCWTDDSDDYDASAKKSKVNKKYKTIHKKLNKLGGFTKEDEEKIPIEDDDAVEIEDEDGRKVVEIESKEKHKKEVERGEESDSDNLNACSNKKRKSRAVKRVKMKKGENMPEDADDFKEDNEAGSGSAGSELPEDADDQQNQNEKGSGNAGSVTPKDADEQQNVKASARKARLARMQRAKNKSARKSVPPVRKTAPVNKKSPRTPFAPPVRNKVRKFSVTNGGSPDQTSYIQRYQQSPMVRDAIDSHFGASAKKSFDERAMMQERIDNLTKSRRNPSQGNGVPKRLR